MAIDLVGPIAPASDKGNKYILTFVNYATRCLEAVPLKNIDTKTVAEALLDMIVQPGWSNGGSSERPWNPSKETEFPGGR